MKYIPHDYQKKCIYAIMRKNNIALFLDMGLGKTVITLSAFYTLKYYNKINNCLVIAPKKVAESVWKQEANKWEHLKNLKFSLILGSEKKRKEALNTEADVYIINRDNTEWLCEQYKKQKMPFDMLIIDELSSFKSSSSKRFRALAKKRNDFKRIVGLTGTPSPNGYIDLWSEIYLIDGGLALGSRIGQYRARYFTGIQYNTKYPVKYEIRDNFCKQEIQKLLKPLCISMSAEDYLKMPKVIYNKIFVELSDEEMQKYQCMEYNYIVDLWNEVITASSAGVLTQKLLQLSSGAIYTDSVVYKEGKSVQLFHTQKIDRLKEIVEVLTASGENVLLFYIFQHEKDRILEALKEYKIRVLQDEKDVNDWNNGEIQILLAQPQSASYGLNLQKGGHHIIWFSLTWNLEHYQQANARLYRQGQNKPVIIHHLIAKDTIDEVVYSALQKKENVQDNLLKSLSL